MLSIFLFILFDDSISSYSKYPFSSKNFAKLNGLSVQEVLQNYMFERFLERLSKSEYKEKFIIKGRFSTVSDYGD